MSQVSMTNLSYILCCWLCYVNHEQRIQVVLCYITKLNFETMDFGIFWRLPPCESYSVNIKIHRKFTSLSGLILNLSSPLYSPIQQIFCPSESILYLNSSFSSSFMYLLMSSNKYIRSVFSLTSRFKNSLSECGLQF